MAILDSKWPTKPQNAPISMKFGFQVDIGVASPFPVLKCYPASAICRLGIYMWLACNHNKYLLRFPNRVGNRIVFLLFFITIPQQSWESPQQSWESYCFSTVFYYYYDSPTELGIVLFFYCFFFLLLRFPNRVGNRIVFLLFFIIIILFQLSKFLSRAILINYLMELIETCNIDIWQCELV